MVVTPDPDLDELDSNWGDEPEEEDDDVDGGWGEGSKHRTAAERDVARKVKAQQRSDKRKTRDALIEQKQKKKQPKKRASEPPPPEPKKKKTTTAPRAAEEPRAELGVEARVAREKRSRMTLIVVLAVVAIAAA